MMPHGLALPAVIPGHVPSLIEEIVLFKNRVVENQNAAVFHHLAKGTVVAEKCVWIEFAGTFADQPRRRTIQVNQYERTFSGNGNFFPVDEPKLFVGNHAFGCGEFAKRRGQYIAETSQALP